MWWVFGRKDHSPEQKSIKQKSIKQKSIKQQGLTLREELTQARFPERSEK